MTRREHLEQVSKQTGKKHPSLLIKKPDDTAYLWLWFCQLINLGGEVSLNSLSSWASLFKTDPLEYEINILHELGKIREKNAS